MLSPASINTAGSWCLVAGSSYHVSAKLDDAGVAVISSAKNWGTANWENQYKITLQKSGAVVSAFDYSFKAREQHIGHCSLDLLAGS
jgi:hypothetical protein